MKHGLYTVAMHGLHSHHRTGRRQRPITRTTRRFAVLAGFLICAVCAAPAWASDKSASPRLHLEQFGSTALSDVPPAPPSRYRMVERRSPGILDRLGLDFDIPDDLGLDWTFWPRTENATPASGAFIVPASATPAQADGAEIEDPLEAINRLMFGFNTAMQGYLLEPFTEFYIARTSREARHGVRNFFDNLREPLTVVSAALEGEFADAGNATARFGINSTLGVVGVFDPATGMGYPRRTRDLEETLCVYGLPAGPYLVLPILGPATLRDAVGRLLTVAAYFQVMGPTVYFPYRASNIAVDYTIVRDRMDFVESIAIDPYIAYRTLYLEMQNVRCGKPSAIDQYFHR